MITFDNVTAFGTFTHDSAVKEDVMDKEDNGIMYDNEGRNDEDIADKQIVLGQTACINDRIIYACQRLLQQGAGKDFGGFQSVCLGQTMCFFVEWEEFIQGLHAGHSHWVTITIDNTVDPLGPVLYVYDSTKQRSVGA